MGKKRLLTAVLALLMVFSGLTMIAEAADGEFDVSGSKTAEPVELEDDRTTTVTLSLPSGEYQNVIDIVFTMDSSSSAVNGAVFLESVNELFASILENNPNIELRVGVIRFRGRAHDAVAYLSDNAYSGLVPYNDETRGYIEGALSMTEAEIKAAFGSGSNTHGGMDIADEWLAADTEVPDDHKYVVVLTDGKTYIWNNEDNEPTTIYSQWYRNNSYAMQNGGIPALSQSVGYNKYAYPVDVLDTSGKSNIFVFASYEDLYNSTSDELTGVSPWDAYCNYADPDDKSVPSGTVTKHTVTNGAALFGSNSATYGSRADYQYYWEYTPAAAWEGVPYLEGNPFAVIDNGDGTYTFDTETINPNYYQYHVDCLQKGMYMAGHLWSEMNAKYNCAVITYSGGSTDSALSVIRPSFIEWLQANSKYGADITNSGQVDALFEGIDNSIRYMVASGVVTDEIPEEFDLVIPEDGSSPFSMTLAGEPVASATDGENKWVYGEPDGAGVYPYVVEWDPAANSYVWTLNVPVENTRIVTLSYDLQLKEEYAKTGWYDTNVGAKLDFVTTDGDDGTFEFEIPQVHYREKIDITVTKVWEDADDQDGIRPDSVTVSLLANGEEAGSQELSEDNDWTFTFEGLYKHDENDEEIEYTFEEADLPDGYVSDPVEEDENVWVITNTHEPEVIDITVTKVWEDEDDAEGLRPDSVSIQLYADGKASGAPVTLNEAGGWASTWTDLDKFADGKEIVYTVEELNVPDGYTPSVAEADDGFTVTNVHKPDGVTYTVTKVWDDSDNKDGIRPDSVSVQLYADGKACGDPVTLNAANNWTYTWENLDKSAGGAVIDYSVKEITEVTGYTAEVKEDSTGYAATVTNTHKPAETVPGVKTGDNAKPILWAGVALASVSGVVAVNVPKKKKGKHE